MQIRGTGTAALEERAAERLRVHPLRLLPLRALRAALEAENPAVPVALDDLRRALASAPGRFLVAERGGIYAVAQASPAGVSEELRRVLRAGGLEPEQLVLLREPDASEASVAGALRMALAALAELEGTGGRSAALRGAIAEGITQIEELGRALLPENGR